MKSINGRADRFISESGIVDHNDDGAKKIHYLTLTLLPNQIIIFPQRIFENMNRSILNNNNNSIRHYVDNEIRYNNDENYIYTHTHTHTHTHTYCIYISTLPFVCRDLIISQREKNLLTAFHSNSTGQVIYSITCTENNSPVQIFFPIDKRL